MSIGQDIIFRIYNFNYFFESFINVICNLPIHQEIYEYEKRNSFLKTSYP